MSKIARIPVSNLPVGVPGLVRWIKGAHPQVYRALAARLAVNGMAGLGLVALPASASLVNPSAVVTAVADSGKPGTAQLILDSVKDLISVGLPLYQQQKLFDLQIKRAQQNLAPLDTQAIADASALRVGVDSSTRNTGLIVAGVLGGSLLLFGLMGRRGRR